MSKKYIFTESDYISGDGMQTYIWGPPMWHILHTISFNYPINPTKEQKKYYYIFFINLKNILPCKYCRDNLIMTFSKLPFTYETLKNRENFSKYVYTIHELVNENLGKSSNLSYEDVRDRYEHFRSRCINNPYKKNTTESGCTEPLYGLKSQCVLSIVPKDGRVSSFKIDQSCIIKKKYK
jgi:hypothetical protein